MMSSNSNLQKIAYLQKHPPIMGQPLKVAQDIYWLRLPLPFALDHVNVWLIEGDHSWSIVDVGLGDKMTRQLWQSLLTQFLNTKPIEKIIFTHFHPDHLGLSGELVELSKAKVFISRTEWLMANMLFYDEISILSNQNLSLFRQHGLNQALAELMASRGNLFRQRCTGLPTSYHRIKHLDWIQIGNQLWQCLEGSGHSPEHLSFYQPQRNILIAGDQILPKITPNIPISLHDIDANPVDDYLKSLLNFKAISNDALILPSHGLVFKGIQTRISQLIDHHQQRLELLLASCSQPISAFDLLPVLFKRKLDLNEMNFAMLEAISHMVYLHKTNKLERYSKGGVYLYQNR